MNPARCSEVPGGPAGPAGPVPEGLTGEELQLAFRVIGALRGLRFGSVQLQVHEGAVVQIDVAERMRLHDRRPGAKPPSPPRIGKG